MSKTEDYTVQVKNTIIHAIRSLVFSEYGPVAFALHINEESQQLIIYNDELEYFTKSLVILTRTERLYGNLALDSETLTRYFNNNLLEAS